MCATPQSGHAYYQKVYYEHTAMKALNATDALVFIFDRTKFLPSLLKRIKIDSPAIALCFFL